MRFGSWRSHRGADLVLRQQFLWAGWLLVCATWDAKFLCGFSSKSVFPPAPLWVFLFVCFYLFVCFVLFPFYLQAINRFVSWFLWRVSALKKTSHLLVTERMWGMRPSGPSIPPSLPAFAHAVEEEQGACRPWEQTLTLQVLLGGAAKEGWQWRVHLRI